MTKIVSLIITIILFFETVPLVWVPTLKIDASETLGEVSTKATGFLYGLAEPGVPSEAITDSLDISSVSQKVPQGLQHPTGDVEHVAEQLEECDYRVVYLQDSFDTWYYCEAEIMEMRKNGTYDWKSFIEERFFPLVREKVEYLSQQSYADDIVYCIYNECDNAVWFGNYVDGGVHYDDIGKANFYEAWKMTYDLVKSIDPDAKIGGPGFYDYNTEKITGFMTYCKENNCVPEIMIYHELNYWSIPDWQAHVDDYRSIEKKLGVNELPIIVTEYGCMDECGNPGVMVHYITAMEKAGTYGNVAFWRLANNLNDTTADDNSPNSNWWLYRKYAELDGQLLKTDVSSIKTSHLHDTDDWRLRYTGLAALSDDKRSIDIICAGSKDTRAIKLTDLGATNLGNKVDVKVECVYYKGLTGIVSEPILIKQYTTRPSFGTLNFNIKGTDTNAVYFITVSAHEDDIVTTKNGNLPVRYEFEHGRLTGTAYTYDSAYATTGEQNGMCGGFEKIGDGVKITVNAETEGLYNLDIIYGKHNDAWGNPDGRDFAQAYFTVDGQQSVIAFENTIKSEYTTCKTIQLNLTKGKHTIEFSHKDGTFVLDSLLMSRAIEKEEISVLEDSDNGTAFLAVAPYDGFYKLDTKGAKAIIDIDGAKAEVGTGSLIYLRRGLNEITFGKENMNCIIRKTDERAFSTTVKSSAVSLKGSAELICDKYGNNYIGGISSEGGSGTFKVNAPKAGGYRVTLLYANNSEGGVHSYNVDLIERYVTVSVNGKSEDVFCRNTYSKFTYKTMTFNLTLNEGVNEITLSNSGNFMFNNMEAFAPQIKSITVNALAS